MPWSLWHSVGEAAFDADFRGVYSDTGTCYTGLALTPGASCLLQVTFDPTTPGARSAVLQIGSTSVVLSGTGAAGSSSDGPMPLWAYAMMGVLILAIGTRRQMERR
jgi:hypothetical protein